MKQYYGVENDKDLPYSQAIRAGNTVYVAGQGPDTLDVSVEEQARQTLANVEKVLKEAGATLQDVVKVQVVLNCKRISPKQFDEVYKQFFTSPYPVRTVVNSDIGFHVEVDVIAVINDKN